MHQPVTHNIEEFRIVGVNYKKSDAAVRGLFAVNQEQYSRLLATAADYGVSDFFILSTCNRTEIYGFAESDVHMMRFVSSVCAGDEATFAGMSYSQKGIGAISHLYQVASGLDSQILGDYEILGQIKCAVKFAKNNGYIGAFMERLINSVLQSSKSVKTNTELSGGTVSVSFAAIQYIREFVGMPHGNIPEIDLTSKKIVLIGTGKIGRVTCRNVVDYLKTKNITLINRTEETAINLAAELGLRSAPIAELQSEIQSADIVLVSTNATEPVILKKHLETAVNKLVIDISVPCNVATDAQQLEGIRFVDVDMLSKIKDETLQKRKAEVPKALIIIEEHIAEFVEWCNMRKHVPVLREVKSKLLEIPISPMLLSGIPIANAPGSDHQEKVQKVINNLATRMRRDYTPGCHYIQAINDFIAL